jgi:hypothetical protein
MSAAWPFFFSHWATSRQIDEFDRCSGGPAVPHNSIAACLARSRSGCMRAANGVVAVVDTWRLSQSRKSSSTIANSEPLIGSMWSSLMIRSSPDLSASRTTAAALPLLALRRWRTSAMASPNDSNRVLPVLVLTECFDGQSGGKRRSSILVGAKFTEAVLPRP